MRYRGVLSLLAAGLWTAACDGGGGEKDSKQGEATCVSDRQLFQELSVTLLDKVCITCHNPQGLARTSGFVLASPGETNYLQTNFETLREVASLEREGVSQVLLKPLGQLNHGGGTVLQEDSPQYQALKQMVGRFKEPVACDDAGRSGPIDKVVLLDLPDTLRKVKVQLIGELPSAEELALVSEGGVTAFDELVLGYLDEDPFYDVLKSWFNDQLLTDKYVGGDKATNLLNGDRYPGRYYYRELPEDSEEGRLARRHANNSVAREPLELIAYIVRNGKPFTEVLTADYILVNPFSARVYGADVRFDDPLNPAELREARLPGVPHAGILTSPMFLNRFPTTDTNRNRHRSRMVWQLFLATDILEKADRPVDPTRIRDHNPTLNNPQCTVCHAQLDPLAGAFQNWDAQGNYRPPEMGWFSDMLPPGYGQRDIPPDDWSRSLQWLGKELAKDEKFALSAVYAVYTGLVGRRPLDNPTDDTDPRFAARLEFHTVEQAFLRNATDVFVASGYDLKAVVPEVVRSPFYRAVSSAGLTEDEMVTLEPLGTARLLTPEELHRRLIATTGYPWKRGVNDRNFLTDGNEYLFFYGGIDSDNVTQRITEPNGIMANIGLRMANEMGCLVTPRDLQKAQEERILFPHVERSYRPEDDNGFEVPQAVDAIRKNIRYLHHRLLGEVITPGHPEEDATYALFLQTWREGYLKVRNGQLSAELPGACRVTHEFWSGAELPEGDRLVRDELYTVRAWSAVVTYLLADWRFLYHQ